jgi:hypothetical protein
VEKGIRTRLSARPATSELRNFGLIVGGILVGVFGLIAPWLRHVPIPRWPWIPGLVLLVFALIAPRILRYPFFAWTRIGKMLGWINTRIVLNLIFFVIFMPAGMVARRLGWDPLERRRDPDRTSYRTPSAPATAASMEKPY